MLNPDDSSFTSKILIEAFLSLQKEKEYELNVDTNCEKKN
jgi:hypothetical protein